MQEDLKYRISLEDLFSRGIQSAEGHAKKFEGAVDSIGEHFNSLKNQIVGAIGIFEAFEFGKSAVEAFVDADKIAAQLKFTIGNRGGLASDFGELTEKSEKLGKSSFFNPIEIQNAANRLLNFGVSVQQTKGSLEALTNVGVAKGKSLDEVVSAIGMAAAGGRAMALKEYGLGFLKLEKDMSKAGAEARNFKKITDAMGVKFGGATDAMQGSEFFKMKKLQDQFLEFREAVGGALLKAFDMILPSLKKGIEYLMDLGRWVRDNAGFFKSLAVGVGVAALAFGVIEVATGSWALAQGALNAVMLANPITQVILVVGALTAAIYEAISAHQEMVDEFNHSIDSAMKNAQKEQTDELFKQVAAYEKLGDSAKKAREEALAYQKTAANQELENAQKSLADASKRDYRGNLSDSDAMLQAQRAVTTAMAKVSILKSKNLFDAMDKKGSGKGALDEGLGSGLSEPKASKIQNITINLNNPFSNQKITMGGGDLNVKDLAPKFTEFLISLVQDASIVATE